GVVDFADGGEELGGGVDVHGQNVADVFAFVGDAQGFVVETPAVAQVAGHAHVGQKVHLDFLFALAAAGTAAAIAGVKGEARRGVAAQAGVHGAGEEFADGVPDADVSGRAGAR